MLKAAFALNDLHKINDGCVAEIENLQLRSLSGWGQPSRTTLHGILHLLARCRAIWEYRLTSRRRLYPFVEDHVNKRTMYLNIGDSYFVSDACARFAHNFMFAQPQHLRQTSAVLVKMFPELNGMGGAWCIQFLSGSNTDMERLTTRVISYKVVGLPVCILSAYMWCLQWHEDTAS